MTAPSKAFTFLLAVLSINTLVDAKLNRHGCSMNDIMSCVVQLKSYNVMIDTNMMSVVFSITSEAKLMHVCRAYNNVMPCFQQRLATCANEKQRARLAEVNRLLLFICAPFSLKRQKTLLKVSKCVGQVLNSSEVPDCHKKKNKFTKKLDMCRQNCDKNDIICLMSIQVSELGVCTVLNLEEQCGSQAAEFYSYMQTAIIGEEFPIQCKYDSSARKLREFLSNSAEKLEVNSATESDNTHFVVQELVLPISPKTTHASSLSINNTTTTTTKNAQSIVDKMVEISLLPNINQTVLTAHQSRIRQSSGNYISKTTDDQKAKVITSRSKSYTNIFNTKKKANVSIDATTSYSPVPTASQTMQTMIESTSPTTREIPTTITTKSAVSSQPVLNGYYQKSMIRSNSTAKNHNQKSQTMLHTVTRDLGPKLIDATKELKTLAPARERYTPRIRNFTTIWSYTSTSTSTTTTTTTPRPTVTTTTTTTQTSIKPVTEVTTSTVSSNTVNLEPKTVHNFLPWYYASRPPLNFVQVMSTPVPLIEKEIIFPVLPFGDHEYQPRFQASKSFASTPVNTMERPIAKNFLPNYHTFLTTTTISTPPRLIDEVFNLLNLTHDEVKHKASTLLTSAIDALNTRNRIDNGYPETIFRVPPAPQVPDYTKEESPNHKALNKLVDTIERISPRVIDKIRVKLDEID